jgi:hypothetical protein
MVDDDTDNFIPVEVGNEIRITYRGMYKTDSGGKGYDLLVEVNR